LVLAELASGRAAGADDSAFVGEDDDLDAVAEVELGEDAGDMAFDGRVAEVELRGDLGVGEAAREQPQDLDSRSLRCDAAGGARRLAAGVCRSLRSVDVRLLIEQVARSPDRP
jgi:hypothetical protein